MIRIGTRHGGLLRELGAVARQLARGFTFCGIAIAALTSPPAVARAEEVVIRHALIFDGVQLIPEGEVWVRDGKIHAVGEDVHAPSTVRVVDAKGETLLPGLIDAHTHVWGNALREALVFGVTTELDMFTDHAYAAQIKKEQAEGKDLDLADLRSAGTLVTAPHGHGTEYGMAIPTISGPEEAQTFVDARIDEGSDYIKIVYDDGKTYGLQMPTISEETMKAVIQAAHRRGKLAVIHIGSADGARAAILAGADGLAHLFVDAPPAEDFAPLVSSHHAFIVPTLSVLASVSGTRSGRSLVDDPRLRPYLSSTSTMSLGGSFGRPAGGYDHAQATVRQLEALHVPILAGTDAPNPGTAHGASLHGELALLVDAGLTPAEALVAATSAPAAAFHLTDRGRIAPGMRADLLLVRGDPTVDITSTRDIVSVWKEGVEVDRAGYRASLEKEAQAAALVADRPAPAGSETGLISDFEDGTSAAHFGAGWFVSSDSLRGGDSRARMRVVAGGAGGSKQALEIEGVVMEGPAAWAGAMFFPGATPMAPVNLSGKSAIAFEARGDGGSYCVMVFSETNGYMPKTQTFQVGDEWTRITFPLKGFETDGHGIMGIFFGASTPGRCGLRIDNVRLE